MNLGKRALPSRWDGEHLKTFLRSNKKMKEINYKDLKFNPFNLIGGEWMLITAGDEHSSLQAKRPKGRAVNTMTASWGHHLSGNHRPELSAG